MKQKGIMALRIGAFVFTMLMLVAFSCGTMLMSLQGVIKRDNGERKVQFSSSGGPSVIIEKFDYVNNTIKVGENLALDSEIKLVNYKNGEAVPDDKYSITGVQLYAYNIDTYEKFEGSTQVPNGPIIPKTYNTPGTYKISSITVVSRRLSDNSLAFHYITGTSCRSESECANFKALQKTFNIEGGYTVEDVPIYEYTISFKKSDPEVYVGDEIKLDLRRVDAFEEINMERKDLKTMMLSFTNETDGNVVNVYVKDLNQNTNIVVPSTATPGKYNLDFGYLTFVDDTTARYQNTDTKTFSYNSSFIVKEKPMDTTKYEFNNVVYNEEIAANLEKLDKDAIITIDANTLPVVDEAIFDSIKDTKRTLIIEYETSQWVFSGADITTPKSIDVKTLFTKLTDDSEYYDSFLKENVTGNSALLRFADNGDLPGKVLIKIDKESVNVALDNPDKVYVYFYKEDKDKLVKVAMEIQSNKDFYEFYINHNSKYILTTAEVNEEVVDEDLDMLSLNHQIVVNQQQLPILYIIASVFGGIAIILLIIRLTQRKQQSQQQQAQ